MSIRYLIPAEVQKSSAQLGIETDIGKRLLITSTNTICLKTRATRTKATPKAMSSLNPPNDELPDPESCECHPLALKCASNARSGKRIRSEVSGRNASGTMSGWYLPQLVSRVP